MVKKIFRKLTPKQREDLEGFEDVVDIMFDINIDRTSKSSTKDNDTTSDSYELYNFLDTERNRLKKLDHLFGIIVPNIEVNSQTIALIELQAQELEENRELATNIVNHEDSIFFKNISELFNKAFSS